MSWWWHLCVFKVFPWCPPVNLNLLTVYNDMDAVIMCSDGDPDPPNILESDKVMFNPKLHYYIIISKQEAVWLPHSRGQRLFSGGKFTEVSVWRADHHCDLFSSQTPSELKFFAGDRRFLSGRNVTKSQEDRRFSTYNCSIVFLI